MLNDVARIERFAAETQHRNRIMRECAAEYRDLKMLRAAGDYMINQTGVECAPIESQILMLQDILASELRLKGF